MLGLKVVEFGLQLGAKRLVCLRRRAVEPGFDGLLFLLHALHERLDLVQFERVDPAGQFGGGRGVFRDVARVSRRCTDARGLCYSCPEMLRKNQYGGRSGTENGTPAEPNTDDEHNRLAGPTDAFVFATNRPAVARTGNTTQTRCYD